MTDDLPTLTILPQLGPFLSILSCGLEDAQLQFQDTATPAVAEECIPHEFERESTVTKGWV